MFKFTSILIIISLSIQFSVGQTSDDDLSINGNDISVSPKRLCDYTLLEETLIYTIQFQNTSKDNVENVVIKDSLDANLDLSTFTLLSSSHPAVLNTSLNGNDEKFYESNAIKLLCTQPLTTVDFYVSDFFKLDNETETIDDAETTMGCSLNILSNNHISYLPLPGIENVVDTVIVYGSDASGKLDTVVSYITIAETCDDFDNGETKANLAAFEFKTINLSDATSNIEGSKGYVSYMISPKNNLPENTIIKNSSAIYFNNYEPIFTNTVRNVLVSELPNTTWCKDADNDDLGNTMDVIESCEQPAGYVSNCSDADDTMVSITNYDISKKVSVYPNPSTGSFQILLDDLFLNDAQFNIYNSAGAAIVPSTQLTQNNQFFEYQYLPNGVYYVNIQLNEQMFTQKKLLIMK